ncbi:hypothetical protein [Rubrimonas cliftonensis]|uniref:Uncharacterized protein n=1 Tax=Rubrimonas cliftonensis TaxID=89524 RepID=A0A1H4ERB2_9RHOB|nr:hypothetical protein [Rubrimonas cliftonensis]SEA87551.1 hypothetical protein SAMN05444370_11557 [Rubrimonas cliftonensis]
MTASVPAAAGGLPPGVSLDDLIDAAQHEDGVGFCLDCGAENHGVEPDAERYPCESCGALKVYGAEQIALLTIF